MKAPKRAIELTLRISADSWDAVLHRLNHYEFEIRSTGRLGHGVSGGYDSGDMREVELHPEMTHERYAAELKAHLDALHDSELAKRATPTEGPR